MKETKKVNIKNVIDYKNLDLLKKHINTHSRIQNRRKSGTTAKAQRSIAEAIKRARFMGLLPYVSR